MSPARIAAVNLLALMKAVVRALPFHLTTAPVAKPLPFTVSVKAPEPAPGSGPARASEPAARVPARSTLARLPAIQLRTAQSVSPQQVLSALQSRGMMEEWQLAQEIGMAPDALEKLLSVLEDDGQVRLMTMGDGQRMVVRID